MARDTLDDTPIEGLDALVAYIAAGEKPAADFRIGTEHEKFAFNLADLSPVPYEGENGIGAILTALGEETGWEPINDQGRIIGLAGTEGGGAISIEPGGQFELSGAPLATLHETCVEANGHLVQVREIAEKLGIGFLGLGFCPTWTIDEAARMPKQRYDIMRAYMPKVGTRGLDMMHRTATIQVNLDFSTEADMVKKMRVGLALQPVATALFANSPFVEGVPNGLRSNRGEVWRDVDLQRSGPIPFAFEDGFGYERYVDWALDVPMYFVKRGDAYIEATGATFRQFMDGRFDKLPGERPTMGDWINHLSTLFPDVRLKRFLEMRGADAGPWGRICALPAFWVGLLYDDGILDQALAMCDELTAADRTVMWNRVPTDGLLTHVRGRTVAQIAREALALASEGLRRRARANGDLADERTFLTLLEDAAHSSRSPADELVDAYYGVWNRDIDKVFETNAF
ncbi:glutamate--cysteine ligase [Acuticoccus sp. I52.16.1]|uniref:glutamate--cysteine ligase n=1 Tax=Acuticoccus sp. I52.16.1 TaxID=2928472 RepID=UPI001FD37336|nr:glutamate--cysteine ligase [Acuticoccus sp. I52.16.1]UOM35648.1 glutamate--cysteine ligase [Acuticoccus sp. I52.16.1]